MQRTGTSVTERHGRPGHGEGLGEGEGMEELALLAGEGKDRDEGQNDNGHREKDRPSNQAGRITHGCGDEPAIARVNPADLDEAEGILGHHDGRIHQDADGDGDPGQGHQIGADPQVAHAEKGRQDGQGQRQRHNQHRA